MSEKQTTVLNRMEQWEGTMKGPCIVLQTPGTTVIDHYLIIPVWNISQNIRQKVSQDLRYQKKLWIQLLEKQTTILNRIE